MGDQIFGEGALSSYRFIDLTDEKGALCSRLLAGMGAEVIRIEPPGGDRTRKLGPFLGDVPHPERSLFFWQHNASKRSITLNLEEEAGRTLFLRLVDKADGVVESLEPGYLEGLGLGYTALSARQPDLVMTSITPFGQSGPRRSYKASELVLAALGGQVYLNGEPDTPPLKPFGFQAYHLASLYATAGTLLALRHRHASGVGQYIDVSIQECVAASLDHTLVRYFYEDIVAKRQGSQHWSRGFRLFPCRDGYILLSLSQDWEVLMEWLDSEGMAQDLKEDKWKERQARLDGLSHIVDVLERWTLSHTTAELVEKGQLMRFPWAKAVTAAELMDNPQLRARAFLIEVEHPELGVSYEYPGVAYKLEHDKPPPPRRAPFMGEDNVAIYCGELGMAEAEMADLMSRGVI